MPLPIVQIRPAGLLSVEVRFGFGHFGLYDLWLWNREGTSNIPLAGGLNTDDIPDTNTIQLPAEDCDGRILHWRLRVAAFDSRRSQPWNAQVIVLQDGAAAPGGTFEWSGMIDQAPIDIEGGARLAVS